MAYNTTSDRIADRILDNAKASLGKNGVDFYKGTTEAVIVGGTYCAIQFLQQATIEKLVISGCDIADAHCNIAPSGGNIGNITVAAGTILYGDITKLKLSDANVIAFLYKK